MNRENDKMINIVKHIYSGTVRESKQVFKQARGYTSNSIQTWLVALPFSTLLILGAIACDSGPSSGNQTNDGQTEVGQQLPNTEQPTGEPSNTDQKPGSSQPIAEDNSTNNPGDLPIGNPNKPPDSEILPTEDEIDLCSGPINNPITRPIIFVHGIRGKNDGFFDLFGKLIDSGRYSDAFLAGIKDHKEWHKDSAPCKRTWLFAFDYYAEYASDTYAETETDHHAFTHFMVTEDDPHEKENSDQPREKEDNNHFRYTASSGRIGSNGDLQCDADNPGDYLTHENETYGFYEKQPVKRQYAKDLADFVESVKRATGADKVDIVAHSMGGLVTRSYISFFGGKDTVQRVLLVASPISGNRFTFRDGIADVVNGPICNPEPSEDAGFFSVRNGLDTLVFHNSLWSVENELQESTGSCKHFSACNGTDSSIKNVSFGAALLTLEQKYNTFGPNSIELHTLTGAAESIVGIVPPSSGCHIQECTTEVVTIKNPSLNVCDNPIADLICPSNFATHQGILKLNYFPKHLLKIGIGSDEGLSDDKVQRCELLQTDFGPPPEDCSR